MTVCQIIVKQDDELVFFDAAEHGYIIGPSFQDWEATENETVKGKAATPPRHCEA